MSVKRFAYCAALLIAAGLVCCAGWHDAWAEIQVSCGVHNGRPTVFVDGRPRSLAIYSPVGWSRTHFTSAVPYFAEHRMDVYMLSFTRSRSDDFGATVVWEGDTISTNAPFPARSGHPTLDEQAEFILERNPEALFIVRNLPDWPPASWRRMHEDQLFVSEYGERMDVPSLASEAFWEALANAAGAAIRHVRSHAWSDRVIGYWVGMFGEGTYEPLYRYRLFDHSPVMTERWRRFLRDKYGAEQALRETYGDQTASFDNISVPRDGLLGPAESAASIPYWQAGPANAARRDYLELVSSLVRNGYRRIMAEAASAAGGRLCLYDAFKMPMLGWNLRGFFDSGVSWMPFYPEMMSGGGYIGVAELFDEPGFDGLITPHDYQSRGAGGIYEPEGAVDSMILRGKFFFVEMDTRTYNNPPFDYGSARDDREYAAVTWRNLAASFTRGASSYWMDLCGQPRGWFGNESIHRIIERQVSVIRESAEWKHADVPGIAVVLDDSAVLETNGSGHFFNEAVMAEVRMGLPRCGVPFRIYLFEDMALSNFPPHRVFYFPNLFRVDEKRMGLLRARVMRDGNVVVWGPGSGISDGRRICLPASPASAAAHAEEPVPSEILTGFSFEARNANCPRRVQIVKFDHPITADLGPDTIYGSPLPYGPALYPLEKKGAIVLGLAWAKQGRMIGGLAVKSFGRGARADGGGNRGDGDWASVFTAAVPLPAALWRNIARYAGAHVYIDTGDVLMADETIVAVHSVKSGVKVIRLPGRFRVIDVINGRLLGRNATEIRVRINAPETVIYRLEK